MVKKQATGVTKSEILDAGISLFKQHGIKMTVKDVASAANVSRQMVYQYFNTRGGLLTAIARRMDEDSGIKKNFSQALDTQDPKERIENCVKIWLDHMAEIHVLASELTRNKHIDPDAEETYRDRISEAHKWFYQLVQSLKYEGHLNQKFQVEDTTALIICMVSPQFYEQLHTEHRWKKDKIIEHLSEVIIRNIFV